MRRWWMWLVGVVTLLAVASVVVSFFIDEPLRRYIEQQINAQLQGYTVRIGALDFHPFSLSVDLKDVVIVQDGHPDPPVVCVPELSASVQWRALLAGRLVSDIRIERPRVHLNLMQVRHEARDEAPVQERGWQEALQAVYPLRINELWVVDGEFTYIDTQLVGDDIVVRFVGLGGLCSTETAKGTGEDFVGVVGATDGPQMGHSVRSPRKRGPRRGTFMPFPWA
jgi:uncharacterized protein involved in outer membrane biogenesis